MKINAVSIQNFRSLDAFDVDLAGDSRFIVGENGIGKSALITAIARALGNEVRSFQRDDFHNLEHAIEIQITLRDLSQDQRGVFVDAADFGANTSLTVGIMATWDPDAEEVDLVHGYPTKGWRKSTREERDGLEVFWIPEGRDPGRFLQLGWRQNLIGELLSQLDLNVTLTAATEQIKLACEDLATTPELLDMLRRAGEQFGGFIPNVDPQVYSLSPTAPTGSALLRQLQLSLEHAGVSLPLNKQSSGVSQLTLFAFALLAIRARPGSILLVDEPEAALHPQSQRALMANFDELPNQCLVSTHSATLLDHADPRKIMRLHRVGTRIRPARPQTLTDPEAAVLARFTSARNAEAFFARTAILVEGDSDRFALEALARRLDRNLDAEAVSIVVMDGAAGLKTFLALLGPRGLSVALRGLCDDNEHEQWASLLHDHGIIPRADRTSMEAAGFFVSDRDLEDVLIRAVGEAKVISLIAEQGESRAFASYCQQPHHVTKPPHDQLHDFLHSKGRQVTYAPRLVDHLNLNALPHSLKGVLDAL